MRDLPHQLSKHLTNEGLPGEDAHVLLSPMMRGRSSEALSRSDKDPKLSAVMVLLYPEDGQWHNVLIRRTEYPGTHSGQISFPGGRQEPEDESFEQTAIRETEEEVGVARHQINLIHNLTQVYIPPSNFLVHPFLGWCEEKPNFKAQPEEVVEIISYPIEQLLDPNIVKETDIMISSGFKLRAPYFDIQGHVVWGATAIMLSEVREILRGL